MELEQKQAEIIQQFVNQASKNKDFALCSVITDATSNPFLFAFSEILDVPNVAELKGTEHAMYLNLLRLFAHGTWSDYKCNAASLPVLIPEQVLKLKQLTVLTLAETNKMLPYDQLMQQLDITNVRDLEDFLINECMYAGIVSGKLDQQRRCFEVLFAAGRDLRPGQLGNMIHTLADWLSTSDNLLVAIQDQIKWADTMSEANMQHKKQVGERADLLKATLSEKANVESRHLEETYLGGLMDVEEDRTARPKRRRYPRHWSFLWNSPHSFLYGRLFFGYLYWSFLWNSLEMIML